MSDPTLKKKLELTLRATRLGASLPALSTSARRAREALDAGATEVQVVAAMERAVERVERATAGGAP